MSEIEISTFKNMKKKLKFDWETKGEVDLNFKLFTIDVSVRTFINLKNTTPKLAKNENNRVLVQN